MSTLDHTLKPEATTARQLEVIGRLAARLQHGTASFAARLAGPGRLCRKTSYPNTAKALRSRMAPRLGLLFQLCKMATTRLSVQLDKSRGQRHLLEAHVMAAERLHADDTTVPVLAKGKTDTGRCWIYVRDDRPDPAAFRSPSCSRKRP